MHGPTCYLTRLQAADGEHGGIVVLARVYSNFNSNSKPPSPSWPCLGAAVLETGETAWLRCQQLLWWTVARIGPCSIEQFH
jgi:hypothetical protein